MAIKSDKPSGISLDLVHLGNPRNGGGPGKTRSLTVLEPFFGLPTTPQAPHTFPPPPPHTPPLPPLPTTLQGPATSLRNPQPGNPTTGNRFLCSQLPARPVPAVSAKPRGTLRVPGGDLRGPRGRQGADLFSGGRGFGRPLRRVVALVFWSGLGWKKANHCFLCFGEVSNFILQAVFSLGFWMTTHPLQIGRVSLK